MDNDKSGIETINIRWHGRGGQGAITAAKIVAMAAFDSGYPGVVMVPTFGTERRGAPVFTSLKLSKKKIYDLSPIETPDILVILDHLILAEANVLKGLKPGGIIVLNTPLNAGDYTFKGARLAVADIIPLAEKAGLPKGIVNSGIIGSMARASGLIDMDVLEKAIKEEFKGRRPKENAGMARLAYENTYLDF
ncbi:MAG: 2-oxoacid:acceptor oxidoreductase family protein [Thermodesulfobacteriota bacterium]|nr:2-oxoacid:acceptor oxidoreductase family protein [Thermodesulfobacteriota bacterium]